MRSQSVIAEERSRPFDRGCDTPTRAGSERSPGVGWRCESLVAQPAPHAPNNSPQGRQRLPSAASPTKKKSTLAFVSRHAWNGQSAEQSEHQHETSESESVAQNQFRFSISLSLLCEQYRGADQENESSIHSSPTQSSALVSRTPYAT